MTAVMWAAVALSAVGLACCCAAGVHRWARIVPMALMPPAMLVAHLGPAATGWRVGGALLLAGTALLVWDGRDAPRAETAFRLVPAVLMTALVLAMAPPVGAATSHRHGGAGHGDMAMSVLPLPGDQLALLLALAVVDVVAVAVWTARCHPATSRWTRSELVTHSTSCVLMALAMA